jgi:hypothetical protein
MSQLNFDGKQITNSNLFFSFYLISNIDVNNWETLDRFLAVFKMSNVVIESEGSSLFSRKTAVLLESHALALLFEGLNTLIVYMGELHVIIVVIPHTLDNILGELDDSVSSLS